MDQPLVRRRRIVEPASPPSPNHNQPSPQERQERKNRGHDQWTEVIKAAVIDANKRSGHPRPPQVTYRERDLKIGDEIAEEFLRRLMQNKIAKSAPTRKADAKKVYDES